MEIKTLHGKLQFNAQRFKIKDNDEEKDVTYFDLTHQFQEGYICDRLKEFSSYYSNRLSYEDVEELIERVTGKKQLSDQKIRGIVVDKLFDDGIQVKGQKETREPMEDVSPIEPR